MIIGYNGELEIGKVYRNRQVSDERGRFHFVTLQVLREATKEEYLAFNESSAASKMAAETPGARFYLVSMD